jgi:eukaryotic-like serine/threonine-protein kinase
MPASSVARMLPLHPMSRLDDDRTARRRRPSNVTPSGVTAVIPSRTEDEARLGELIDGRYRLDALVGRGGMGVVYRAEHVAIRRTVALKLLHPALAGIPELRRRFEREAAAIGRIEHPNCVNVSDFGAIADGSLFLVMEYLEGRSLGDLLEDEHHLRPRRALRILRHVLAGLDHAHQAGIVHRDIKPDNVVLLRQGGDTVAKILDFGIAKVVGVSEPGDQVKLTQAGVAFGTPIYMSPEQALGNPVDGRADLYSASVMAYEMLTGRPPFYADDKLEVMSMHTTRDPPPMDTALRDTGYPGGGVPRAVEGLIRRGLTKRPDDRFASAGDYIAALDVVLLDLSLEAAPDATSPNPIAGDTGARPLVTTTGSSLVAGPAETALGPTVGAHRPRTSAPVELVKKKARAWWRRRPLAVAATGATLAVAVTLAIVLALGGGGGDDASDGPPASPAAHRAATELGRGNPGAAIKSLEAQRGQIAHDPSAQLQLGHAYAAQRKDRLAVDAYLRAVQLSPAAGDDPQLRANLRAITDDKDLPAAMGAFELLVVRLHDRPAIDRLVAAAADGDAERRVSAIALVGKLGLADKVDWLTSYSLDLDQDKTCAERKEDIAKLRALGDVRAIPALEKAIDRRGHGRRGRQSEINRCLADDARAALVYLRSLTHHSP